VYHAAPATYDRIIGAKVVPDQRIRVNGEWYLIIAVGETVDNNGHAKRAVQAQHEETELTRDLTIFVARYYSYERAKVSQ
jgi:hypothetical protein